MLNMNRQRLDANETAFFERQLASIEARLYMVMFPERTILRLLSLDTSDNPGAETYICRIYEQVGMADFLAAYSAGDVPAVDVVGSELVGRFHTLANKFGFDLQEIRAAAMANTPLEQFKAEATQLSHSQKWNQLVWFGDTLRGMYGILTHPNIPKGYASSVNGSTKWLISGVPNKTPDQINADLSALVREIRSVSKNIEQADTLLLPITEYGYIADTYRATVSDKTILEAFENANPGLLVDSVPELEELTFDPVTGSPASTSDVHTMVAFSSIPRVSVIKGPIPFEMSPPDISGFRYDIEARSRIGGFVCRYPLAWNLKTGI